MKILKILLLSIATVFSFNSLLFAETVTVTGIA